jgi:hypothetical protein
METSPAAQRLIGRFAWIMAWVGLAVGVLHALADTRQMRGTKT